MSIQGKIKMVMRDFGFIIPGDGSADVYFHRSNVQPDTFARLASGQRVTYEVKTSDRGNAEAFNLVIESPQDSVQPIVFAPPVVVVAPNFAGSKVEQSAPTIGQVEPPPLPTTEKPQETGAAAMNSENSMTPTTDQNAKVEAVGPLPPDELARAIQHAFGEKAAHDGWASLASVGSALKKRVPGFEPRHYGYEKLSGLLKNCGLVEIHQDDSRFPPTYSGKFKDGATISNIRQPLPPPVERPIQRNLPQARPHTASTFQPRNPTAPPSIQQPALSATAAPAKPAGLSSYFFEQPRFPGGYIYCWSAIFGKDIEALARLALRETWEFGGVHDPRRPYPILESYLRYTFYRLWVEQPTKILVQGKLSAFNTGLVDRRYEPIFALFGKGERAGRPWHLMGFCIAGEDNFGKELVRNFNPLPEPPHYFQSPSYMFYDVTAEAPSVDWEHVIIENLERLPMEFLEDNCPRNFEMKNTRKMTYEESRAFHDGFAKAVQSDMRTYRMMKSRLDAAVELALKRVRWNFKTAIPVYFPTRNQMNMLLPLALVSDDVIDIALVVEKTQSGNYLGHTILPLDWAYNNARLVCRPNSDWLSPDLINKSSDQDGNLDVQPRQD